jgi:hypothetical protein
VGEDCAEEEMVVDVVAVDGMVTVTVVSASSEVKTGLLASVLEMSETVEEEMMLYVQPDGMVHWLLVLVMLW